MLVLSVNINLEVHNNQIMQLEWLILKYNKTEDYQWLIQDKVNPVLLDNKHLISIVMLKVQLFKKVDHQLSKETINHQQFNMELILAFTVQVLVHK